MKGIIICSNVLIIRKERKKKCLLVGPAGGHRQLILLKLFPLSTFGQPQVGSQDARESTERERESTHVTV